MGRRGWNGLAKATRRARSVRRAGLRKPSSFSIQGHISGYRWWETPVIGGIDAGRVAIIRSYTTVSSAVVKVRVFG